MNRGAWTTAARAALTLACTAVLGLASATTASAAARPPALSLKLSAARVKPGDAVAVLGRGWPRAVAFQAALCGNGGVDGNADCDNTSAIVFSSADNGVVEAKLDVTVPPRPCPCVVLVIAQETGRQFLLPVKVVGVPTAAVRSATAFAGRHTITISDVVVRAHRSFGAWLGAPAARTLAFEVHNTGPSAVYNPVVAVRWGKGATPNHVVTSPEMKPLAAGETQHVEVPFRLDGLAFGRFTVVAEVSGAAYPADLRTATSNRPWGLVVLTLIVLAILVVVIGRAISRRMDAEAGEEDRTVAPFEEPLSLHVPRSAWVTLSDIVPTREALRCESPPS
jgi:hypothetical protein